MKQGIPAHVLVERVHYLLTNAQLSLVAGKAGEASAEVGEALRLLNDLRGAIQ